LTAEKDSIKLSLKIIRKPFINPKRILFSKDKFSEKRSLPPSPKNQKQNAPPLA